MKCNTIILKCLNVSQASIIPYVSNNVAIASKERSGDASEGEEG